MGDGGGVVFACVYVGVGVVLAGDVYEEVDDRKRRRRGGTSNVDADVSASWSDSLARCCYQYLHGVRQFDDVSARHSYHRRLYKSQRTLRRENQVRHHRRDDVRDCHGRAHDLGQYLDVERWQRAGVREHLRPFGGLSLVGSTWL